MEKVNSTSFIDAQELLDYTTNKLNEQNLDAELKKIFPDEDIHLSYINIEYNQIYLKLRSLENNELTELIFYINFLPGKPFTFPLNLGKQLWEINQNTLSPAALARLQKQLSEFEWLDRNLNIQWISYEYENQAGIWKYPPINLQKEIPYLRVLYFIAQGIVKYNKIKKEKELYKIEFKFDLRKKAAAGAKADLDILKMVEK